MKITIYFWLSLAITAVLFISPTIQTYNAPSYDGIRVYGFPLVFNSAGGFYPDPGCDHQFKPLNLLIDILFVFIIPIIVNLIAIKLDPVEKVINL